MGILNLQRCKNNKQIFPYNNLINFFEYPHDFKTNVHIPNSVEFISIYCSIDLYKYVEIDLSEQKLEAYRGGRKVNEFLISSGIGQYPTPVGDFSIWLRLAEDRMTGNYGENHPDNYDIPDVPYVMYFNGPYALHGAYWHNNFGHPMSHGCINVSVHDAAWLYNWTTLGDKVFVRP